MEEHTKKKKEGEKKDKRIHVRRFPTGACRRAPGSCARRSCSRPCICGRERRDGRSAAAGTAARRPACSLYSRRRPAIVVSEFWCPLGLFPLPQSGHLSRFFFWVWAWAWAWAPVCVGGWVDLRTYAKWEVVGAVAAPLGACPGAHCAFFLLWRASALPLIFHPL